jgi:V-type H+-transporting ATPase subunit G
LTRRYNEQAGRHEQEDRRLTSPQHSSGNQKAEEDAKKETDVKVKEIDDIGNKSGSKVVDQLIAAVINAKPEPPRS